MIKNKLNSKKGITIISLIIIIIILLILSGVIIENVDNSSKVAGYNNMVADIRLLEDKLLIYFNKYREIPKTTRSINIKDIDYYEIDLSKLDNITLNYGQDYGESEELILDKSDVYVVNDSLEVYYVQGINLSGERYYKISDGRRETELEYTELEYIESTGTQYIDTGIAASEISKVEGTLQFSKIESNHQGVFGGRWTSNNTSIQMIYNGSSKTISLRWLDMTASITADLEKHTIVLSNEKIVIDNEVKQEYSKGNTTDNDSFIVFARRTDNSGSGIQHYSSMKVYSLKITTQSGLVRDFIPCKDENGTVCLYDKVEGKYYYNQGTGDFIAGPEV